MVPNLEVRPVFSGFVKLVSGPMVSGTAAGRAVGAAAPGSMFPVPVPPFAGVDKGAMEPVVGLLLGAAPTGFDATTPGFVGIDVVGAKSAIVGFFNDAG